MRPAPVILVALIGLGGMIASLATKKLMGLDVPPICWYLIRAILITLVGHRAINHRSLGALWVAVYVACIALYLASHGYVHAGRKPERLFLLMITPLPYALFYFLVKLSQIQK